VLEELRIGRRRAAGDGRVVVPRVTKGTVRSLPARHEGRGDDVLPRRGSGGKAREYAGNIGGSGDDMGRGLQGGPKVCVAA
jgi:hypothetical protein